MKVPVKWLNEHVQIDDIPIKTLEERLIMSGSNTEGIHDFSQGNTNIVVGRVLTQVKHPDADKLFVLKVDLGDEVVQIVTGARNVTEGDYVPVAKVGASLAKGLQIKKSKLRGEVSEGMLVSLDELGFSRSVIPKVFDDGIYILEGEYQLGTPFFEATAIGDRVIEFEITPNRADCLCIEGMARETQATFGRPRKALEAPEGFHRGRVNEYIEVEVLDRELCPRYAGFVIKNANIEPSPQWMQIRLMLAGVRPINNIVDVTNYVMLETGNPIHPFDLDQVDEGKIIVRRALPDEEITTLDSVKRKLSPSDLVIASPIRAIGLAGIMGGENTEITPGTRNIFVEVAAFNKTALRLSSKALGLRTEASGRFEKGIDTARVSKAIQRLLELYREMNVGELVDGVVDIYPEPLKNRQVTLTRREVKRILGIHPTVEEMIPMLEGLEFTLLERDDESLRVEVPACRLDVVKEIDLVEEIARIYGYDRIPATIPGGTLYGEYSSKQKIENRVKSLLVAKGLVEIATYSFVSPASVEKIRREKDPTVSQRITLVNPLGEEYSVMRTTLVPNLLEVLVRNHHYGASRMIAFEMGNTFIPRSLPVVELPDERLSLVMGGFGEKVDFFTLKGLVELLFEDLGIEGVRFVKEPLVDTYHPGRFGAIRIGDQTLGYLGEFHPEVLENFEASVRITGVELDFEKLMKAANLTRIYNPVSRFPAIERDIALLVSESVTNEEIIDIIKENGGRNLAQVKLFDIYRGDQIQAGYKSVAYNMVFRAKEDTLTYEAVQKPYDRILEALEKALGALRR
ncbi:MAG: hypothetical protein AVO33_07305 [delta proteobacterium ML8_F1]|nr:MAG: hypothetical protein AVO33_07305 [delta proteobacterium ML8_F1]